MKSESLGFGQCLGPAVSEGCSQTLRCSICDFSTKPFGSSLTAHAQDHGHCPYLSLPLSSSCQLLPETVVTLLPPQAQP